jgi:hypothetical protein
VFHIIDIGRTSVKLDNTSNPPSVIVSSSTNCPREPTLTNNYVAFTFIRVLNNERTVMEHIVLCQPYLKCIYCLKYNTLLYDEIVKVTRSHTNVQPKVISYNTMCLTQILTIWHIGCMFCQRTLQQNLFPVAPP